MMLRRLLLPTLLTLAVFIGPAAHAAQKWQCYTYDAATTDPVYQTLAGLAAAITKASDGQLEVACHPGGSLPIKASTIAQSISEGVLQFGLVDSLSYNSLLPAAGVLSLPGLYANEAELNKAIKALLPTLNAGFAKRNIRVLGISNYPLQVIWSTRKITSLADLKGMKLRVTSPEQAAFAVRFGATPITLGMPDVATSLQRGIIQGVLTASVGGGLVWQGLLHYNLRTGPNYVSVMLLVNKARLSALPAPLQEKISALSAKAATKISTLLQTREDGLTAEFAKKGMVVIPGTPADAQLIAEKMRSYWPKWAKENGPAAAKALAVVEHALKK
ncbi:MAG: TRAP transporter substrate-binding protein DctP [Rhodospirillales bacterium]|nr:TRAP transporter substrate-binding protein DctP [Rhodospirillales bacterium]